MPRRRTRIVTASMPVSAVVDSQLAATKQLFDTTDPYLASLRKRLTKAAKEADSLLSDMRAGLEGAGLREHDRTHVKVATDFQFAARSLLLVRFESNLNSETVRASHRRLCEEDVARCEAAVKALSQGESVSAHPVKSSSRSSSRPPLGPQL